ncbi:dienelactone hydrolase family protein [Silicimonas sp. MF1-12-2]|uniref:dienelactone hydrolase family protein n=1 Tax=Silicimonas sp. MF1-12-2 TaxID=3384793 RepID=UPI0039B6E6CB
MTEIEERGVEVAADGEQISLPGTLLLPPRAKALIVFAHGSGSSRLSPRNRAVAEALAEQGFATLLFDLLTEAEARDRANVFDIPLLAERVGAAIRWVRASPNLGALALGLFGASTGAAAALVAAAKAPGEVGAVVSRGGRPDMAEGALLSVEAPTLLIVGGADHGVIELNEAAHAALRCPAKLEIIPGATHLFEEPGALAAVVDLAARWFDLTLTAGPARWNDGE